MLQAMIAVLYVRTSGSHPCNTIQHCVNKNDRKLVVSEKLYQCYANHAPILLEVNETLESTKQSLLCLSVY